MNTSNPVSTPEPERCSGECARAIPFLVAFGLVYVGAIAALHFIAMPRGAQLLVALAPAPVFGLYLWLAIAYPVSLLLLMTLGLLQVVGALPQSLGEFLKVWPAVAWLYVMGVFVARKRYR